MRMIVSSLIGTLAAVCILACMLACTAGATLYCSHCLENRLETAIGESFEFPQPGDAVRCIPASASDSAPAVCDACADKCLPADEGMSLDSKVVAVLIQELCEASPDERAVWMKLLRNPNSDESYFNFFAHYHGKTPLNFHRTCSHVEFTCPENQPQFSPTPPCACLYSCPYAAHLKCDKSCKAINAAIAVIEVAEKLMLEQPATDDLSQLRALRAKLTEMRQQLQECTAEPDCAADAPCDNDD